jgi:hypothetical protein
MPVSIRVWRMARFRQGRYFVRPPTPRWRWRSRESAGVHEDVGCVEDLAALGRRDRAVHLEPAAHRPEPKTLGGAAERERSELVNPLPEGPQMGQDPVDGAVAPAPLTTAVHDMAEDLSEEAFDVGRLPRDYAPLNVEGVGGTLYVAFAKTQPGSNGEVAGPGSGFVDVFSPGGRQLRRLQHGDWLNAPWGMALAPSDLGKFGPDDESHGLFGALAAVPAEQQLGNGL